MTSTLVAELRRRMAAGDFNQKSLARAAGLNETAVRDILVGRSRHPRHDTVEKLARALGCAVADLIDPRGAAGRETSSRSLSRARRPSSAQSSPTPAEMIDELVFVPTYEISAAAGEGIVIDGEHETGRLAFRHEWLRGATSAPPDQLAVITVRGDSMYPTLAHGDAILVDLTQRQIRADGIYIVRFGDFVLVKRLHIDPVRREVTISCDNTAYPPLAPVTPEDVEVAGRVIWVGRKL